MAAIPPPTSSTTSDFIPQRESASESNLSNVRSPSPMEDSEHPHRELQREYPAPYVGPAIERNLSTVMLRSQREHSDHPEHPIQREHPSPSVSPRD